MGVNDVVVYLWLWVFDPADEAEIAGIVVIVGCGSIAYSDFLAPSTVSEVEVLIIRVATTKNFAK